MRVRRSMIGARIGLAALAALMAIAAWGQGFNIDVDDQYVPPPLGGGVPSGGFGGAAGQVGFWNPLLDLGTDPVYLADWSGSPTSVLCTMPRGGSGGGNNFAGNTGDFALLLNDGRQVGTSDTWRLDGLVPGAYQIYVYAVSPSDTVNPVDITVDSDGGSQTLRTTGPMPGNAFILGQTHQVFDILVEAGPVSITADRVDMDDAWVNGFQIVPVPELGAVVPVAGGVCLLLSRRRRKKRVAA